MQFVPFENSLLYDNYNYRKGECNSCQVQRPHYASLVYREHPHHRDRDRKGMDALKIWDYSSKRVTGYQRSILQRGIIPRRLSTSVAYRSTSQKGLFTFYFSLQARHEDRVFERDSRTERGCVARSS